MVRQAHQPYLLSHKSLGSAENDVEDWMLKIEAIHISLQ